MSSAHDEHGKHDAHGHDGHGHDAPGGLPVHEMSNRFGIAAAALLVVAAFVLQFTLGGMGGAKAETHETAPASHEAPETPGHH